ncbi:hypothetical protein [Flavobacterium covae]|uniref:hypothetical protein n=1 Tax=Flavobacterium covae TaxID=2906076 RepID=UPI003396E258
MKSKYLIITILISCFFIFSCSKDEGNTEENMGITKLAKAKIADANYIYQNIKKTNRVSASVANSYFKINKEGKSEPIEFITDSGRILSLPINKIYDINSSFLWIEGEFGAYSESNFLLVHKKTELIYSLPKDFNILGPHDFFTDNNGDIYLANYNSQLIYKIDSKKFTLQKYLPEGQGWPSGGIYVNNSGVCFYQFYLGGGNVPVDGVCYGEGKLKLPNGRIYTWDELIQPFNIPSGFTTQLKFSFINGEYYILKDKSIYRVDYLDGKLKLSLVVTLPKEFTRMSYNSIKQTLLFFCTDALYEFDGTNLNLFWNNDKSISSLGNELGGKTKNYFINSTQITSLDLLNYAKKVMAKPTGFEFYKITTSLNSDDISFSGLRYSDGKIVIGTIDSNGNITSIVENNSNDNKIENLIKIN